MSTLKSRLGFMLIKDSRSRSQRVSIPAARATGFLTLLPLFSFEKK